MTNFTKENLQELQELIQEVNENTNGAYDNVIKYHSEEFWEVVELGEYSPLKIANMTYFGSYSPSDEFIGYDGNGNIESMNEKEYFNELEYYKEELKENLS